MSRIVFFASLREATGVAELSLDLAEHTGVKELMAALKARLDSTGFAAVSAENVRIALNQQFIQGEVWFGPGDEIAFLPPVTGG